MSGERFWSKVDRRGDDECWPWLAGKTGCGYGAFALAGRVQVKAHRYAYELLVGTIPDGLTLDHLCRNRACVNPAHLEPVSSVENTRRGVSPSALNQRKETCPKGHPLVGDNLAADSRGRRSCRTCRRERDRLSKRAKRAAVRQEPKVYRCEHCGREGRRDFETISGVIDFSSLTYLDPFVVCSGKVACRRRRPKFAAYEEAM